MPNSIKINRAPVLTLWAAMVAERLGFDRPTALTLGQAVAGLSAYAKGVSLGIIEPKPDLVREQSERLAEGELVCIFPEGALTRDGNIGTFKSGVEKILARRPVPVVPMALRGMWSSMWSHRDGRLGRMRVPRRFRARVEVAAAAPLPAEHASAELLEQQVKALRGEEA